MTAESTKDVPPTLTDFPFQTFDKLRYADTDRQGHVNNAVFSTFLETGRVEFLFDTQSPLATDNASFVIARLTLDFVAEVNWPGRVEIGTGVTRIGNSSLTLRQAIFFRANAWLPSRRRSSCRWTTRRGNRFRCPRPHGHF